MKSSSICRLLIVCGAVAPAFTLAGESSSSHWAFQPIRRTGPPEVRDTAWPANPIDRFVLSRLEQEGITPSPEADRSTLIRRLSLDLTGLPPSPEDVDAFVNDPTPHAYEKVVNRLLASPHFGERWARYWLDLARYADSDGFEKDLVRPHAWRYRHWVIDALNRDMPYDQFLIEQLAGDLLPGAGTEQLVATGFHRNTLTNREGGVDEEQFRVEQVVDRTNTTAAAFMGLTMACAQCHDHKYDPISQKEYYGFYAFFNAAMEKDVPAPLDEEVALFEREMTRFNERKGELERRIRRQRANLRARLPEWEQQIGHELAQVSWTLLKPAGMISTGGATFTPLPDGSVLVGGNAAMVDTYTVVVPTDLNGITGFRLEVLTDDSLPRRGPGRAHHGNFILSEIKVTAAELANPSTAKPVNFAKAWADLWEEGWPIEAAFDGDTATGWSADAWRGYNEDRQAVFIASEDVGHPGGTVLTFTCDHQYGASHAMGRFRLYAATGPRERLLVPPAVTAALAVAPDQRTPEQTDALLDYFGAEDPVMRELKAALDALEKTKPTFDTTLAQTLAANPNPPETHIHVRGDFLTPGERVSPHTPSVLPPLRPRNGNPDRLDLARWLVGPEHPLTARVAANRVWERLFGRGLVETSEDFGTRGTPPSHPELLDWLAADYMARGWSTKELIKLIVSSRTYKQSSRGRPELEEIDPDNILLARQNRYRVEAEIIRDLTLAVSGLLNPAVGGPSVRPPLPEGVADLGYANTIKWPESGAPGKYRRGLYIHFQRTVPYPMLMTFDCPDSNVTAIRRMRSNTPLQALTLMNDPVFFECAQALGARLYGDPAEPVEDRLRRGFKLCLGRDPHDAELDELVRLWEDQFEILDQNGDTALRVTGDYLPAGAQPQQVAPWVMVARALMNLDEFVTRE